MRVMLLAVAAFAGTIAPVAMAGPCDAYFRFDGDLKDSGENGYDGRLVVAGGEPATTPPSFYEGEFGKSLRLDGQTVMYSPLDLQKETCPQVTIAAWILIHTEAGSSNALVSTGYARPGLAVGTHSVSSYAGREIRVDHAVRRGIWIFVAGTWDYEARTHRIYWRNRWEEHTFPEQSTPPQKGFWVGGSAYFADLIYLADKVLIDEVRVWGRVLSEQELREVQAWRNPALVPCNQRQMDVGYEPPPDLLGDLLTDSEGEDSPPSASEGEDGQGDSHQEPTTTDDPPTGQPRPTGDPAFSAVAGFDGTHTTTLDLQSFLTGISWRDSNNVPCQIWADGETSDEAEFDCPSGFLLVPGPTNSVELEQSVIGSIDVCSSFQGKRLKGIRISGDKVKEDGSLVYVPAADEDKLTNCGRWSGIKMCPSGHVGTGLVVRTEDRSGDAEQIVGLQLICRRVTVE